MNARVRISFEKWIGAGRERGRSNFNKALGLHHAVIAAAMGAMAIAFPATAVETAFQIPAQPLSSALAEFSRQSGKVVTAPAGLVSDKLATPVQGAMEPHAALTILVSATGLVARQTPNGSFIIARPPPLRAQRAPSTRLRTASQRESAEGRDIEEIIVTATRREELLSKVPVSITASSRENLERQNVTNLNDLQRQIASLTFNGNTVAIRGISSNIGRPTTGVYIDDTPIQTLGFGYGVQNPVPMLTDLERVEVLRGPQGTLFGGGAMGGVVRYITPRPSLTEFSGVAKAEVGFIENGEQNSELAFAYGGPLIEDRLGFRVSGELRNIGGWIDYRDLWTHELVRENGNNSRQASFRLALSWAPTDDLIVTPSFQYQDELIRGSGGIAGGGAGGGSGAAVNDIGTASLYYSDLDSGEFAALINPAARNKEKFYLPGLKVEYETPGVSFISNTSAIFFTHETVQTPTFLWTSYIPASTYLPGVNLVQEDGYHLPPGLDYYWATSGVLNEARVFTQEIRAHSADSASRLSWVAGAFYSNSRNLARERDLDPYGDQFLLQAVGQTIEQKYGMGNICDNLGCDLNLLSIFRITSRDLAAFGEVGYKVTDRWKLTVGVRQTHTRFSFYTLNDGPAQGRRDELSDQGDSDAFTPKFNLSFQADGNNLFYGTISKGFRGGGGNSPLPYQTCAGDLASIGYDSNPTTFDPDTTWSYEIGAKNRLFGGSLTLDSSVYTIHWENMQTRVSLPCAYSLVLNTGDVTTKGFETAANALLNDRFSANLAVSYMHGEYTGAPTTPPGTRPVASVGDRLTDPDWKVAAGLQYNRYFNSSKFIAQLDYVLSHIADAPTVATNPANASYNPDIPRQATTHLVTARTGVSRGNLDVSLFVFNLLNDHDVINLYHRRNTPYYLFTSWRPRTWTLQAMYHF